MIGVGLILKPPSGDYDVFLEHLGKIIMIVISKCKNIIICGDLNIDKLNNKDIRNKKLNDLFNSFELLSLVTVPTRVVTTIRGTSATSIDYVVTNIKIISVKYLILVPRITSPSHLLEKIIEKYM